MCAFLPGFTVVTVVAFADGGYFRETWLWTTIALSCLALLALLLRDGIVISRLDLAALVGLAAFVGWVSLSSVWSALPTSSLHDAQRGLIYVAALLAFVLLLEPSLVRLHLAGIAVATAVIASYSLVERLVEPGSDASEGIALIGPVGYANALGVIAALGLLLTLGLALHASSRRARVLWLAPAVVLVPALALTESRGAALALGGGLCVLAFTERARVARLIPTSRRPRAAVAILAATIVALVAVAVLRSNAPLGPRADYWRVSWIQWEDNVWRGSGSGTFVRYWEREGFSSGAKDAHSLYLEVLAELGPLGLGLLLVTLATPLIAAVSAGHPLTSVALSAYAAYLIHAGIDWDWEMPAVTLAGLLSGVALLAAGRERRKAITLGAGGLLAFGLAALALAGLALAGSLAG